MLNVIGIILLWILRIIGIILGLIIFLLLLILFVPFRYDAEGSFDEKVNVKVKFSWLLHFINGKFIMDENGQNTYVRIFVFKVYPSKPKKEKPKKVKKTKKTKNNKKEQSQSLETKTKDASVVINEPDTNPSLETSEEEVSNIHENDKPLKESKPQEETKSQEETKPSDGFKANEDKKTNENKKPQKEGKPKKEKKSKKVKKEKKDKEPNKNIEKAKELWSFLQESENEGVLKFITKYVVKILKWLLPKKAYVNMELGLEDPALTGYIAGVTSIVYVATKKNVYVAPNFNEQVIKGDFRIKGRLYLYQLLYYIIRIIIDKRVRRLIKKVRT